MKDNVYPRPHDKQTVYLKNVITAPNIEVGDCTIYNDFVMGGVPAKPIRRRYDNAAIRTPGTPRWWDWAYDKIKRNITIIQSGSIAASERAE